MQVRTAAHVAVALRDARRQRVEIEPVAQKALALQLLEARVPVGDASRQQVGELGLAQERPVAGVVGDQDLAGDTPPAEETQVIGSELRQRQRQAALLH